MIYSLDPFFKSSCSPTEGIEPIGQFAVIGESLDLILTSQFTNGLHILLESPGLNVGQAQALQDVSVYKIEVIAVLALKALVED